MIDLTSLIITFKIAIISTSILLVITIFLAWWLSISKSYFAKIIEITCLLPLLLPPTVLGFYLLLALNKNSIIGSLAYKIFGYPLVFNQVGLVIASIIYSLPFMLQPIQNAFMKFPAQLVQHGQALGKSNFTILLRVIIPNSVAGIISGCVLSFMHTVGEFGIALMVGGNIPNKTQLVSMKIYEEVQLANYSTAHLYAIILISLAFASLLLLNIINKKKVV